MKKVLFIVSSWGNGGVESYISNIIPLLKDRYSFDVLSIRGISEKSLFSEKVLKYNTTINKIEIENIKTPFAKLKERIQRVVDFVSKGQYSIIHINCTTADFLLFAVAIKKKIPDIKIIIHCHGDNVEPPLRFLKLCFHYVIKNVIPNSFDYLIGCSKRTLNWMFPKRILNTTPNNVIYCGIDLEKFKFSLVNRNMIRNKIACSEEMILIGTIGRICEQKNPFYILKIIKSLNETNLNFKFIWVGEGTLYEKVKIKAKEMNIIDKIIFYGSSKNVEKIYSALDIFILPSIYEGNPIVGLEAQANGLKCLFSDRIVEEARITNNVKFLPIDREPNEWKKEIVSIKNKYRRQDMYKELKQKEKDIESCAKELEKIYMKLDKEV